MDGPASCRDEGIPVTTTEAAEMIVELTIELSQARRERATYRLMAVQFMHALHAGTTTGQRT